MRTEVLFWQLLGEREREIEEDYEYLGQEVRVVAAPAVVSDTNKNFTYWANWYNNNRKNPKVRRMVMHRRRHDEFEVFKCNNL